MVTRTGSRLEPGEEWNPQQVHDHLAALETALADLSDGHDRGEPGTRRALEAIQALVDVYGEALARVLRRADSTLVDAVIDDELVSHLLLVHDLHPHDAPTRVRAALEGLGRRARAELSAFDDGVATVVLDDGPPELVEDAVRAAAPEVVEIRIERAPTEPAFVPLASVRAR